MERDGPRHSLPPSRGRVLQNLALPLGLLLVVGVIALASPALRDRAADDAPDPREGAAAVGAAGEPTATEPSPTRQQPRQRPRPRVRYAGTVPATHFEKLPPIPPGWVKVERRATLPTTLTVASYNVLGAGHTAAGGDRNGFADGNTRMRWATEQLRGHGVTVAGFQEFQLTQAGTFNAVAPAWAEYPGPSAGNTAVQNSIVWDTTVWELVEASTTPIPYFFGRRWPMPHVLLENLATGQRVWFANYHNPADTHGNAEGWRDLATTLEVSLFNTLRQQYPLVVTGDMNEREEYLCRAATGAGMHSASGFYADASGCHYQLPFGVDWILGSPDVEFSGYVKDESAWVQRTSDHPLHVSDATIAPQHQLDRCKHKPGDPSTTLWCPPGG